MEHKNKRSNSVISLVPDGIAMGEESRQTQDLRGPKLLFDEHQQPVAVRIGDQVVDLIREVNAFEALLDTKILDDASRTIVATGLRQLQASLAMRTMNRSQIDLEFADSWVRVVRKPWEKFIYDIDFHRGQRDIRRLMDGLMRGVNDAMAAMIAVTTAGLVTGQERRVTALYEQQDYDRNWARHVQRANFESYIGLDAVRLANEHEMAMAQEAHATQVRLAELQAEGVAADLAAAAQEADKEREMRLIEGTRGMFNQVTDMIAELRLLEQRDPEAKVGFAMTLLTNIASMMASPPEQFTPEEHKRWAATLRPMVDQALQEAMKVVKRA